MKDIVKLISKIKKVVVLNEFAEQDRRERGEYFNIFNVLGLTTNETRLHSALLAELLNPKGSHGMRDKFLELFIKELYPDFASKDAKVCIEHYAGCINEDYTEGGRIDILIKSADEQQAIIIENKIYASDQCNQLLRYANYASKTFSKHKILYLTLEGVASESSLGKEKIEYHPISYKTNILQWLYACHKEVANKPLVRETIAQYITLIKQLTNQIMEDKERNEIVEIATKDVDSLKSALKIGECYGDIRRKMLDSIIQVNIPIVIEKLSQLYPYEIIVEKENWTNGWPEWGFFNVKISSHNKQITILYETDDHLSESLYYGIDKDRTEGINEECWTIFEELNEWWPFGWNMCKYKKWKDTDDFIQAIEHFHEEVEEELCMILNYIKEHDIFSEQE